MRDGLYVKGCEVGALVGKLFGAGGGGFLAFFVPSENKSIVMGAMKDQSMFHFALKMEGHW